MKKRTLLIAFLTATIVIALVATLGRKSTAEKLADRLHEKVENAEDAITKDKPAEDLKEAKEKVEKEIKDRKD